MVHVEVFKVLAQDRIQQRIVEQIVDIPARRGLPDFLPGQSSTASSSSRLRDDADVGFQGGFSHFSPSEKSAKLGPNSGSELLPESSPSTRRAYVDADGTPMRMGTRGGSRVLVGGTCLAVIVLCGGMLQGDVVTSLCDHAAAVPAVRRVLRASGSVPRLNGGLGTHSAHCAADR